MYPLIVCSVLALSAMLERAVFWFLEKLRRNDPLLEDLFDIAETDEKLSGEILREADASPDSRVRVVLSGLLHSEEGPAESMEMAAMEEISTKKRGLALMHTIVAVAPLLGILGTVLGIIESFDVLGQAGIDDPRAVTSGIAQALVTTAAGLAIAICTLLPYEYFASKVRKATEELSLVATRFELGLKKKSGL